MSLCVHGEDCIVVASLNGRKACFGLWVLQMSEMEPCTVFLQLTKFFDRKGASVVLCCRTPQLCVCECVYMCVRCECVCVWGGGGGGGGGGHE